MNDVQPVILLGPDDVDALATSAVGLAAAAETARLCGEGTIKTGRVQVIGDISWMRIMAGLIDDLDLLGYKEFHRVGQRVRYHVHLFRQSTGDPIATIDGRRITGLRTASLASVAARHWAGTTPQRVGLIGSGEEAREGLRALVGAINVSEAFVYSPTPANREAYAKEMTVETGTKVTPVSEQSQVMNSCDVLYVATSSHNEPFLSGDELGSVRFIAAIGSTMPVHRELRGGVFLACDEVVVDTMDATHESGDCIEATELGWDATSAITLGNYLMRPPLPAAEGRTLFKSIGSVEQDLVLAYYLAQEAIRTGRGTEITDVASLRIMR